MQILHTTQKEKKMKRRVKWNKFWKVPAGIKERKGALISDLLVCWFHYGKAGLGMTVG